MGDNFGLREFLSANSSQIKTLFGGALWIVIAFAFWLSIAGNPIDELNLILNAETTNGFIVDGWDDVDDNGEGKSEWTHRYIYEFYTSPGQKYKGVEDGGGPLMIDFEEPNPVDIEYLPDNPNVSRIKGSGCSSIWEWLWRKIGIGGIFLILIISPGFRLLKDGISEIRERGFFLRMKITGRKK